VYIGLRINTYGVGCDCSGKKQITMDKASKRKPAISEGRKTADVSKVKAYISTTKYGIEEDRLGLGNEPGSLGIASHKLRGRINLLHHR
jgi:hypothetical protein